MFQTIAEYENDLEATQAEKGLIEACRVGHCWSINGGTLPDEGNKDPNITIRAGLIRLLAVQATSLHENGVELKGALITGQLDLRFATCRGVVNLNFCRLVGEPRIEQAELAQLSLSDSHFPGLFAQGINVMGSVFLERVTVTGTVNVNGAQIGRQLVCKAATLKAGKEKSLSAQGIKVNGSVDLSELNATGKVAFAGAQIGGQLDFTNAVLNGKDPDAVLNDKDKVTSLNLQGATVSDSVFLSGLTATGTVDLAGAQIGGQLGCDGATLDGVNDKALNAEQVRVEAEFIFRKIKGIKGRVSLNSAQVHDLADDAASWEKCGDVSLDGFTYDRISGNTSPKTFAARRDWLKMGSRFAGEFRPQPYTQFAKVMRAAGHTGEARKALMERDNVLFSEAEKADRKAFADAYSGRQTKSDSGNIWLRLHGRRLWSGLSRRVIGHGHRPEYALFWALGAVAFGTVRFTLAWAAGVMVPNSDVILTSADWLKAMNPTAIAPTPAWSASRSAQHYETFYSLPYALDVFVPFLSLGQEQAWAASTVTWFGLATRWMTFAYQIAGWVVTSLGIAAITGFVQRNAPD